jgi:nicotinamidase-related amidase
MFAASGGTGPLADRLDPGLAVDPDDILTEKSASSAFFPGRCPLPGLLTGRGIDNFLITGTVTNVCCESSARRALFTGLIPLTSRSPPAPSAEQQNYRGGLHPRGGG